MDLANFGWLQCGLSSVVGGSLACWAFMVVGHSVAWILLHLLTGRTIFTFEETELWPMETDWLSLRLPSFGLLCIRSGSLGSERFRKNRWLCPLR